MATGRKKYVPQNVLIELGNIKKQKNIMEDCKAFEQMATFSKIGRTTERIVKSNLIDLPKRKQKGSIFDMEFG